MSDIKMKDLAAKAGVSIATVSRVLKNQPGASAGLRSKILSIKNELNYFPSVSAQDLAYRRSGLKRGMGIVRVFTRHMRDYGRGFYVDINNGLQVLNEFGYEIIQTQFANDDLADYPEQKLRDSFKVDGVIFVGTAPHNAVKFYQAQEIPIVFVDIMPENDMNIPYVVSDSASGLKELMNYLISNGHRRIAYARGALSSYATRERFDAYRCSLLDAECSYSPELFFSIGCSVEKATKDWLKKFGSHPDFDFTAVVCENDIIALGIMHACLQMGVRIPEELSIAGIDDTSAIQYAPTPLTTVHIPTLDMGRNAGKLLCLLMRRMPVPDGKFSVRTYLMRRKSCQSLNSDSKL